MTSVFFGSLFVYFLPPIVAFALGHNSRFAILVLTLLLGWTGLGWVVALVWSFTGNVKRDPEKGASQVVVQVASRSTAMPAPVSVVAGRVEDSGLIARVNSLESQVGQWQKDLDDIGRRKPADGARRVEIIERLLDGADREMGRIRGEMNAGAAPTPGPHSQSVATVLTRHVSREGRPYYRNAAPAPIDGYLRLIGTGLTEFAIAGCLHHQAELDAITGGRRDAPVYLHVNALVFAEPQNAHDPNAIAVEIDGYLVGYIPKADAAEFGAELMALGGPGAFSCSALIENGWPEWYVKLDIERPLRAK